MRIDAFSWWANIDSLKYINDTFIHGGGHPVFDNTANIPSKAVRSEDTVIGLRGINVFAFFWTDRRNTANPAFKTDHRLLTNPDCFWLSNKSNLTKY